MSVRQAREDLLRAGGTQRQMKIKDRENESRERGKARQSKTRQD